MPELFDNEFLKKLEYLELISRRLVFGRQEARRVSTRKGSSIEFKDFREYAQGDDPRTVDWSVYARLGELVIKLYRQEEELDLWILLDRSGSMGFGDPPKFDQARRIAAALAYIGMCNMDSASVATYAGALEEGMRKLRGRGGIFRLLDHLAATGAGGETDVRVAARAFAARVRRPSLVVIISDFVGLRSTREAVDLLRYAKHEVHVIQTVSAWDLDPPLHGELRLVDCESGDHRDIVITDSMRKRYRKAYDEFSESLKRYAMKNAVGYSVVRSDEPFDEYIVRALQRGRLLA